MTEHREQHVFGPVPSRRLGRSLGVDLVPFKVCPLDCVYCQLGRTTVKTLERRDYVPVDEVVEDVAAALAGGADPDYITLSGSGEPTLHSRLGEIIAGIKSQTDVPVTLLTNGILLYRKDVRNDAACADLVIPSFDAPNAELFERINRPHGEIDFDRFVDGLVQFRRSYTGRIWLEVFLLKGVNDSTAAIHEFQQHIRRIRPDRIQLNTAVRPTAEPEALAVPPAELDRLCELFGPEASVVADYRGSPVGADIAATRERVLALLQRRPCTLEDVANGIGAHRNDVTKHVTALLQSGEIVAERRDEQTYYRACG